MKKIYLPSGMRDNILSEAKTKKELQDCFEKVFESYGYSKIYTPSIEFFSTYQNAFSNLNSNSMYKFFDQDGNILSLRMDMTVPIARVCATKFKDYQLPLRFYYSCNVFKVRESFAGKRNEVTDCGVELIGLDKKSDVEVLMCAFDAMKALNVKTYAIECGDSGLFKKACKLLNMEDETIEKLADLIDRKSMVDLKLFLDTLNLEPNQKQFMMELPLLNGDVSILSKAKKLCFDESLKEKIEELEDIYTLLSKLDYHQHLRFDLGKIAHLDYYTGLIFEGFVEGIGVSVLSGGRYDKLLSKFGMDVPACGFSIKIDYLLDIIKHSSKKSCKLFYPQDKEVEALLMAANLRKEKNVELIPWQKENIWIKEEETDVIIDSVDERSS